jgi:hypothetical protein
MHESKMHDDNCFITLTYDSAKLPERPFDALPADVSLHYPDFQLFMKRLRKFFKGRFIRFYMAGEYGENFGRPHFHACLFGVNFPDRDFFSRTGSGSVIYRSKILESLWPYGFSSVGDFDFKSAAYVARYVMKKITGDAADQHYETVHPVTGEVLWRTPEFNKMSLKPGIGGSWFDKYETDVFPHDHVIVNGNPVGVPRYYQKLYERSDEDNLATLDLQIKPARVSKMKKYLDDCTEERLSVRERVVLAQLSRLKRKL